MIDLIIEMNRKGELVGWFLLERTEEQLKRAEAQNKELVKLLMVGRFLEAL